VDAFACMLGDANGGDAMVDRGLLVASAVVGGGAVGTTKPRRLFGYRLETSTILCACLEVQVNLLLLLLPFFVPFVPFLLDSGIGGVALLLLRNDY